MNRRTSLAAIAFGALSLLAAPVLAHTQLSASAPADGAAVASPEEISLSFSEAVRLTAVSIESADGSEALEIEVTDPAKDFAVAIPALSPGKYVIQWRALSADTHVMTGEIRFTVVS